MFLYKMDTRLRILIVLVFLVVERAQAQSISGQQPVDCDNIHSRRSGVYAIYPKGSADPMTVFCFMQADGGDWTVIQHRMDRSSNFYRNLIDYEDGFGNLQKAFWLGDSFRYSSGMSFSAKDQDSDVKDNNCTMSYKATWWYRSCHYANLNGLYLDGAHPSYVDGVNWYHWKRYHYSLKATSMIIRERP